MTHEELNHFFNDADLIHVLSHELNEVNETCHHINSLYSITSQWSKAMHFNF